jgi:Interferon-induced transmembrane protein/WW domain
MQSSSEATSEQQQHQQQSHHLPWASAFPLSTGQVAEVPAASPFATVPAGWTLQLDNQDGRIYYFETATGRRSWIHPHATVITDTDPFPPYPTSFRKDKTTQGKWNWGNPHPDDGTRNPLETPLHATQRPDAHQCQAVVACCWCPPLGLFALYHSISTDRAWNQGRYSDAMKHSREAPKYSQWATCLGIGFWIWFLFLRPQGQGRDWFDGIFDTMDWNSG